MTNRPELILHVGAPKCGSSALQSALSMTPDMTDASGQRLRYTAFRQIGDVGSVLYGRNLVVSAKLSAFGYASWPNVNPNHDPKTTFDALRRVHKQGLRKGFVPIASSEGWISRAGLFAERFKAWGHPPVDVVAYLRPVMAWYNSAFWQWGVWNVPSMDAWLNRGKMPYAFGMDLEAWSQIPNVRVRFAWAQPDTVAQFASTYEVGLEAAVQSNVSSSPALVGVLRRYPRLRKNAHEAQTEFVVQRWCPQVPGRRLWSVTRRHVPIFREIADNNLEALKRFASDDEMRRLCEDPRWIEDAKYDAEIAAGVSPMNNPVQLAGLHGSLAQGVERVVAAAGLPAIAVPPCPPPDASVEAWDKVLLVMLDALLDADHVVRQQQSRKAGGALMLAAEKLWRFQRQRFNKSR